MRFLLILLLSLSLVGCGSCLDPWTGLSDCPSGTPGHHGTTP